MDMTVSVVGRTLQAHATVSLSYIIGTVKCMYVLYSLTLREFLPIEAGFAIDMIFLLQECLTTLAARVCDSIASYNYYLLWSEYVDLLKSKFLIPTCSCLVCTLLCMDICDNSVIGFRNQTMFGYALGLLKIRCQQKRAILMAFYPRTQLSISCSDGRFY